MFPAEGLVWGIDLVRWWGPSIVRDLCRAYPQGRIPGCRQAPPAPPRPALASPSRPGRPAPPPAPPRLALADCWVTTSSSADPSAKVFELPPAPQTIRILARFNRASSTADRVVVAARVIIRLDGFEYARGS